MRGKGEYVPLPLDGENTLPSGASERDGLSKRLATRAKDVVIVVLCLLGLASVITSVATAFTPAKSTRSREYHLTGDESRWMPFKWHTGSYSNTGASASDDEVVDAAWDKIVPAHGIVAVDHRWAQQRDLPDTMDLPSDPSKGVYIIDAYHQIHCLTVLRKTMTELSRGQEPSIPMQHSRHCFDSVLQYIMCGTSGDTLLYTWGRNETGDGQLRRCRDWGRRARWAGENTACYADLGHRVPLDEHFGHCETAEADGLEWDEWW